MKIGIIINDSAGTIKGSEDSTSNLKELLISENIQAEFIFLDGSPVEDKIKMLIYKGMDAIVAAGGDGTVNAVASVLAGQKIPLGVLPLGTLNHFAKDLNIPLKMEDAVKVLSANKQIKVDTAEVNGKVFINNSSIGVYPKMVKQRDHRKGKKGNKWIAMAQAFADVYFKLPVLRVKIITDLSNVRCKTPFVFIGNNEYNVDIFNLGSRTNLTDGKLSVYYPKTSGRLSLFRFFFHALADTLHLQDDFNVELVNEVTIETNKKMLEVSADGEVVHMTPPLNYRIRTKDLTVIVP